MVFGVFAFAHPGAGIIALLSSLLLQQDQNLLFRKEQA
jgi:hypothetical protein